LGDDKASARFDRTQRKLIREVRNEGASVTITGDNDQSAGAGLIRMISYLAPRLAGQASCRG